MNIQNLNSQELEQLQILLNKMNPTKVSLDPIDEMINDIMDNFDWAETRDVMEFMEWKWSDKQVPSISEMKKSAERLLRKAAELRLGEYKSSYWEMGILAGSGGFQATAYCDETKTKITMLDLKFILNEWNAEIEN